jgi:nucleoside-triphosphatase
MEQRNLLITGLPGTGKTTLVMRLVERLKGVQAAGFYTKEIRTGGVRLGFEIVDLRGGRTLLSHVDIPGSRRVGKYGVDVSGFERYLQTVPFLSSDTALVIIDEIGKMECLSERFTRLVVDLLDAPVAVVATIALHGGDIIDRIKKRPGVHRYPVTKENRDSLVDEIETAVRGGLAREAKIGS